MSIPQFYPNLEQVFSDLHGAWQKQTLPSTLLLVGKAGVGKKKLALELAKLLCCENPADTSCGRCFSCLSVKDNPSQENAGETPYLWLPPLDGTGKDLDTLEKRTEKTLALTKAMVLDPYSVQLITPSAQHRMESVRDLRKKMSFESDRTQVILIPEADRMNPSVANSLLKTLEEAPARTYFVLTTSHPSRILATILSRSLKVRVPSLGAKDFVKVASELGEFAPSQLELLYQFTEGAPGFCLSMDQSWLEELQTLAVEFLHRSFYHRSDLLLDWVENSDFHQDKGDGEKKLALFWRMLTFAVQQLHREYQGMTVQWTGQEEFTRDALKCFSGANQFLMVLEEIEKASQVSSSVRPMVRLTKLGLGISHLLAEN